MCIQINLRTELQLILILPCSNHSILLSHQDGLGLCADDDGHVLALFLLEPVPQVDDGVCEGSLDLVDGLGVQALEGYQ